MGSRPAANSDDQREAKALRRKLSKILERLPEIQSTVLAHRMGIETGHPMTVADTGRALGLSASEVRDIEQRAFNHLRDVLPRESLARFLDQ